MLQFVTVRLQFLYLGFIVNIDVPNLIYTLKN